MTALRRVLLTTLALLAIVASASAQQASLDRRVGDIVQAGKIRVGLHLPQFVKDPATGEIQGQGTEHARAGTPVVPGTVPGAPR